MAAFILVILYSLACGVTVFDAVLNSLPEAHRALIYMCQCGFAGVCGVTVFCLAYMLLFTIYLVLKEIIRKAVEKGKNGN